MKAEDRIISGDEVKVLLDSNILGEKFPETEEALPIAVGAIQAAEMRQGCTNHTFYAKILLSQIHELYKEYTYLKGDEKLPTRFLVVTRSLQEAYEQGERDMVKRGFKSTKEWRK